MEKKLPYTVKSLDGTNQVSEGFCVALLEEYKELYLTEADTEEESLYNGSKMRLLERLLSEYGVEIKYPEDNFDSEEDVEEGSDINLSECCTLTLNAQVDLSDICPLK